MRHHSIRLLIESSVIAILLMVIAIGSVILWVVTGPRSVDMLSPRIEAALERPGGGYKVKIQNTILTWDSWSHPIGVEIRNVRFLTGNDVIFATLPEIFLRFDLPTLITGNVVIQSLTVKKPVINLFQAKDGSLNFGLESGGKTSTVSVSKVLAGSFGSGGVEETAIQNIFIQDADVRIGSHDSGVYFQAPKSQFRLLHTTEGVKGYVELPIRYENKSSSIKGALRYDAEAGNLKAAVDFYQIVPKMIARIVSSGGIIDALDLPFSGKTQMVISREGELENARFLIEAGKGAFELKDVFPQPIPIVHVSAQGSISKGFDTIELSDAVLEFDKPKVTLKAKLTKEPEGYRLTGRADGENMPGDELYRYWPMTLAPMTREWVTQHIRGAYVPKAHALFNFAPGEIDLPTPPKDAISAEVTVQNATVDYLENYPVMNDVTGLLRFTGTTMDVDLTGGAMMSGTKVLSGEVDIPDLYAPDTRMLVKLKLTAPARDAVHVIALPDIDAAKELSLDEQTVTGQFDGDLSLDFIAFSEEENTSSTTDWDSVHYAIKGSISNVSQPKFLDDIDLEGVKGELSVDNAEITFKGAGTANGIPATVEAEHQMKPKTFETRYTVTADPPVETLPRFGYPAFEFLSGTLGVKATVERKGKTETTSASIDLGKAGINLPRFYFRKAVDVPAVLTLKTVQEIGGPLDIPSFNYEGAESQGDGSAALTADLSGLSRLNFNRVSHGKTQLSKLDYRNREGGFDLDLKGDVLDISQSKEEDSHFSFKDIPAMRLTAEIRRFIPDDGSELRDVKASLLCNDTICTQTEITGKDGKDHPFSVSIGKGESGRILRAQAANAGDFLRSLGIFKDMEGGTLSIEGKFDDSKPGHPLDGKLTISEHATRNAPALTKLLTLTSLTGILDTLGGKGITFTKLSAPFVLENDVITLKDAKTAGPALGLTAEGVINVAKGTINLKGTVVPSYTLNSMLGNLPLVGEVLTGGKGGGVFAASYTMKGDFNDPDVGVNPLTILTPGFLRGLFDIFDLPPESDSAKPTTQEKKDAPKSNNNLTKNQ